MPGSVPQAQQNTQKTTPKKNNSTNYYFLLKCMAAVTAAAAATTAIVAAAMYQFGAAATGAAVAKTALVTSAAAFTPIIPLIILGCVGVALFVGLIASIGWGSRTTYASNPRATYWGAGFHHHPRARPGFPGGVPFTQHHAHQGGVPYRHHGGMPQAHHHAHHAGVPHGHAGGGRFFPTGHQPGHAHAHHANHHAHPAGMRGPR